MKKWWLLSSLLNLVLVASFITTNSGVFVDAEPADDESSLEISAEAILENSGATAATQRVWLTGQTETGHVNIIGYAYKGEHIYVHMDLYPLNDVLFYYADIPYELNSFSFLEVAELGEAYVVTRSDSVPVIIYGTCYNRENNSLRESVVFDADAEMLGLVSEAYLTYGKHPSNGSDSDTIHMVFETFFKNKKATTEEMKSVKILDYGGDAYRGQAYDPSVPKSYSCSVNEKWKALCSNAGIDSKTGQKRSVFWNFDFSNGGTVGIMVIAITATLVGLVYGIYIYQKKRHVS